MAGDNHTYDQNHETHYDGPERRQPVLSEAIVDEIAERAAVKAISKLTATVYQEIGKGVVNKLLTIIGVLSTAAALWAASKGLIKL